MSVIELNNLSKWYGEVIGLNNVTAAIGRGITGLVGPNGAGKSTLMNLAMGQLRPSQGSIKVFGENVWNNTAVLSRIGYCPEGDPFWTNLTGYRFVLLLANASGLGGSAARDAVRAVIDRTGMTEHAHRAIKGYSKGMRQRIKVAQALVHKPRLLILDEPFTGTDPVGRHELAGLLRELAEPSNKGGSAGPDTGIDVLISSHVLHEVEALTQQIMMIDHGRIIAQGDLQSVRRTLQDRLHSIRVRVEPPQGSNQSGLRRLAARLVGLDAVTGLTIAGSDALVIETSSPDLVHDHLTELLLETPEADEPPLCVREISAVDENLEAIFGYLTQRSA